MSSEHRLTKANIRRHFDKKCLSMQSLKAYFCLVSEKTDKTLMDLIERTFQREGSFYIACNVRNAFFTSDAVRNYNLWCSQKVWQRYLYFYLDCRNILFSLTHRQLYFLSQF